MSFSPAECLNRAKIQLSQNTSEGDRYACLGIRQWIEATAYKKIEAYAA